MATREPVEMFGISPAVIVSNEVFTLKTGEKIEVLRNEYKAYTLYHLRMLVDIHGEFAYKDLSFVVTNPSEDVDGTDGNSTEAPPSGV